MSTRTVDIELGVPVAEAYRIVAARVVEGISRLTHVEVEIASHDAIDFSGALNKDSTLAIRLDRVPARSWSMRLSEA